MLESLETRQLLAGVVAEYPVSDMQVAPLIGITTGPDGNLWFTGSGSNVGRITTGGAITEFPTGVAGSVGLSSLPYFITTGPDGNLWFTDTLGGIGRITTGGQVTHFPVPSQSSTVGITSGPDGNLWFTENGGNRIGRITTSGVVTEFPVPTADSFPYGIAAGPDGNLWFAEIMGNKIGRITPDGVITEFPVPTARSFPTGITAGPDGNLWFTEPVGGQIGRITTAGAITEFPGLGDPSGITTGPDGNLWFTVSTVNQIGRITTSGVATAFPIPTSNSFPTDITTGPDGNLWFTEYSASKIGKLNPKPSAETSIQLTASPNPFTPGQPVTFTAVVTSSQAGVVPTGSVTFLVGGTPMDAPLVVVNGQAQASLTVGSLPDAAQPVLATYFGNPMLDLRASSGVVVATPIPTPTPILVAAPPTVVSVRRLGFHAEPTRVVLTFSTPLDPAAAGDVRNYRVVGPGGKAVAVASAAYDPAANTVTLRPRARLDLHRLYQLTVTGTAPGGLSGATGVLLAGAGGVAGTDYVATLRASDLVLGSSVPGGPARLASLKKELAGIEASQAKQLAPKAHATSRAMPKTVRHHQAPAPRG